MARPLPPLACVLSLDEEPLVGRAANTEAWRGYFSSFPTYVIHPRFMVALDQRVAVLGTTTGSHLGLADDEESRLGVIWLAEVNGAVLSSWQIVDDTAAERERLGIPGTV